MPLASTQASADDLPDEGLASRMAAGDTGALRILMRRHNRALYRTARSILKDDSEAEDAVQDAYFLAYRCIGKFRGESKLSTWLIRIVANEAIRRLRQRKRRAEVIQLDGASECFERASGDNMTADSVEPPERLALRADLRRLIEARIDELPDAFRAVFVLRALEETSVEDVAVCLGIPEATVRTRHFRARGMLREALAREIDFSLEDAFSFAGERCDRIVDGVMRRLEDPLAIPPEGSS